MGQGGSSQEFRNWPGTREAQIPLEAGKTGLLQQSLPLWGALPWLPLTADGADAARVCKVHCIPTGTGRQEPGCAVTDRHKLQ